MSRRALAACGLLWVAAAVPLGAQESLVRIQARIDSLAPLVEQAEVEAAVARSERLAADAQAEWTGRALDTLRVADMTIVTPRADVDEARALFDEVWTERFAGLASRSLSTATLTYQTVTYVVERFPVTGREHQVVVPRWASRATAKVRVRDAISAAITVDLAETAVGRWSSGNPFAPFESARVYREMRLGPSIAGRRCMDGDTASCATALGLGTDAVGGESDVARATLVGLALERGGPGAWTRFLEDPAMPPADALTHAAGVSVGTLISEWQARVLAGRQETHAGLGGTSAIAFLWILFFALFATRSTRWRFA
jgi:hypothetical protein